MLNPEVAKQQLEKFKSDRFVSERLARVAGLPEPLRPSARSLFDLEKEPENENWMAREKRRNEALQAYRALPPGEIESMIRTVFPELATYILRAWKTSDRLPYTSGHGRKPFRAASMPNLLDMSRLNFLVDLFALLKEYPADIEWIAIWTPHAWSYRGALAGRLLAAAIDENDEKGQKVFDILLASARGEHEIGQMGRHVISALLISGREEGWEFIEKMLLAAQREEGLRQSIFEAVDECHPDAFRRFLRIALEHDLVRFSATVRAVDVWFGFLWDAMSTGKAKKIIEHALHFLDDPAAGDQAIATARTLPAIKEPKTRGKKLVEADEAVEPAYIALWTKAFNDVGTVLEPAASLLGAAHSDVRFVATHMLGQLGLTGGVSQEIAGRLADDDDRVAARALLHFHGRGYYDNHEPDPAVPDLFERLEKLLDRAPGKTVKLAPIVWPWMELAWGKETAGHALIAALGKRSPTRLLPHLDHFDASTRQHAVRKLGAAVNWDDATRDTLFKLVGDASQSVRNAALQHLKKCTVNEAEAGRMEGLLTRKAADLRQAILLLLLSQQDDAALGSGDRLTASKDELQRLAGLELLRQLAANDRAADACRQRAAAYRAARPNLSADETTQLTALAKPAQDLVTLDNCLGLIDPSTRTKPIDPQRREVGYFTPASVELVKSLDALVHTHREKSFTPYTHIGAAREAVLLGNVRYEFPHLDNKKPIQDQLGSLPFKEIWFSWFENRPASMRDADALELLRAQWMVVGTHRGYGEDQEPAEWLKPIDGILGKSHRAELKYPAVVISVLQWLSAAHPSQDASKLLLDGLENVLAMMPKDKVGAQIKQERDWMEPVIWRQYSSCIMRWAGFVSGDFHPQSAEERIRYYRLRRWMDEPGVPIKRLRADFDVLLSAFEVGGANEPDIYDHFIGAGEYHNDLALHCGLKPHFNFDKYPALRTIVDRCRSRVLEVELTRGETPTCVSKVARSFPHTGGMDVLLRYLRAAQKNTFTRGHAYGSEAKAVVFSHVIRATYPADGETPEKFTDAIRAPEIPQNRLIELAVYAPQWAGHVEHAIGWPHLSEAVWWIHAHTRDRGWSVDAELRERWKAQVAQRTPLEAEDLLDGAVDVAWFNRVYETFGKKRWEALYDVAKFAASGGGHKRAQLFADAMLGLLKAKELVERIESKRNQDSVRALGLLPLPRAEKARPQMLARYKTLQEFIRTSRQFGSMRQASEKRSAAIGMENLARTAGYPDPIRLQWAMESHACADLAKGPATVTAGEVTVSLSIDSEGDPDIACVKKGKTLAAIPPAAKKNPKIAALVERKGDLKRSRSRMRASLELAMVRGDVFTGLELRELMANPLLSPMLARLVFAGQGIFGYPVDGGQGLSDYASKIEPVKKDESLRLAHPHDLLGTKHWSDWQHDCFKRERVQPFKQIFRELYVLTKAEADAKEVSRRYAGHQVQPRQALALLTSRGWVISPQEGVFRTFHELGLTAWLTFQESFFTPADIEGLTLEGVRFTQRSERRDWMQLPSVPPRQFSEVMRDLDLVVSVAHRGGVDPEASASTIQMRTSLLSETLQLLNIKNVRIKESHAFIKGELGDYTLHLGSAITHRQPGGALFIVAVHSQHRGRMFLPFADDDPRTAEVISKVLLLARDKEIKDPNLLAQINASS
jgi:hypothetical protein